MIKLKKQLEDVILITGQDVSNYQLSLFHDYVDILFKWHEKHNILSTRNVEYFIKRDFFDTVSFRGVLAPLVDGGDTGLMEYPSQMGQTQSYKSGG